MGYKRTRQEEAGSYENVDVENILLKVSWTDRNKKQRKYIKTSRGKKDSVKYHKRKKWKSVRSLTEK